MTYFGIVKVESLLMGAMNGLLETLHPLHNILQHSKAKKPTIFNNGRYTTNIPPHSHYNKDKTYIYLLIIIKL